MRFPSVCYLAQLAGRRGEPVRTVVGDDFNTIVLPDTDTAKEGEGVLSILPSVVVLID